MVILESLQFNQYPEIKFGFSTKIGRNLKEPYYFNTSLSVHDNPDEVKKNRELFFGEFGLDMGSVAIQKQVHGDNITIVTDPGMQGESDAMITALPDLGLAVSSADCSTIFLYDPKQKVIAAIHSGWKSTVKRITEKTIIKIKQEFNSRGRDLLAYMGPSVSAKNYRVGPEVAEQFEHRYLLEHKGSLYLDVAKVNYDMLVENGVRHEHIQKSSICNFKYHNIFHSYRRNGEKSGRAFGLIVRREIK